MLDALARGAPPPEDRRGPARPRRLRRVISAGSPLAPELARRFAFAFGVPVGQIYGATEFGSVAYNDPDAWDEARDGAFRPDCVGLPFPGVRVRVRDGQIAVAADSMLDAYLDDPAPPTRDGFLETGDLGHLDERGRIYLTGRLKLMIDVGALKVNPLEVEAVLARHPGVREVVVVPISYSPTASRLKAVIVPEPDAELDREEILRFAREHLIHYKVPRSVEIRRDVPRSPTGKILRQALMPRPGAADE
jgi:acyl-CoA synthetase (AMP-forming)/AMP-acid ligase II